MKAGTASLSEGPQLLMLMKKSQDPEIPTWPFHPWGGRN